MECQKQKTNKELINEIFTEELPDDIYQKIKIVLDNAKENLLEVIE